MRFNGSRRQLHADTVGRSAGDLSELLGSFGQGELLAAESAYMAAPRTTPRASRRRSAHGVAPGDGERLAPDEVTEDDTQPASNCPATASDTSSGSRSPSFGVTPPPSNDHLPPERAGRIGDA